jgi:hypothetical protein
MKNLPKKPNKSAKRSAAAKVTAVPKKPSAAHSVGRTVEHLPDTAKPSNALSVPPQLANLKASELTRDQLLEVLEAVGHDGIRIAFAGKANARRLARAVRPRVARTIAAAGYGDEDARASNLLIEGDNLQSMVTLYKERGRVDLIITDPPYNTGQQFRYNDKWDDDPNDLSSAMQFSPKGAK